MSGGTGSRSLVAAILACALALLAVPAAALGAPPSNDDFSGAAVLSGPQATLTGTTGGATRGPGEPSYYAPGVWFRYTAAQDGIVELAACTAYDADLLVYTGAGADRLTYVDQTSGYGECDGGQDLHVGFHAHTGVSYSIFLAGYSDTGPYTLRLNPPPLNDDLAGAETIDGEAYAEATTAYATHEPGEPAHAGETATASVWFAYTPRVSGPASFDVCDSSFAAVLAVYTGTKIGSLAPVAGSPAGACAPVDFSAVAGRRYLLAVDGRAGARGAVVLRPPPPNDYRKAARRLSLGGGATQSNRGATAEPGEPAHAGRPARASLWYELDADRDRPITIETCGSTVDTTLAVYAEGIGTVASSDDDAACGAGSTASRVSFTAQAGVAYRFAVDAATTGDVTVSVSPGNDAVARATKIAAANSPFYGSTAGATREPGEPALAGGSVWYQWKATAGGETTVDTCSVFADAPAATAVAVYAGATAATLVPVAAGSSCSPGSGGARATFTAAAGTTYRFAVAATGASSGYFILNLAQTPGNDAFAAAADLGTGAFGSTTGATREPGEPLHAGVAGGASRWYRLSASGALSLRVCATFDALAAVYSGTALATLTPVAAKADVGSDCATLAFTAAAGQTYYVAVDGRDGATGSYSLTPTTAPANDDFEHAAALTYGAFGSNAGATAQPGEPAHAGSPAAHSLWYTYTPAATGRIVLDTCYSYGLDTVLAVYRGSALTALTPVVADDDAGGCGSGGSRVVLDAVAGQVYRIAVDVKGDATGYLQLVIGSPPDNDDFADAESLAGDDETSGIIDGASEQAGEPAHAGVAGSGSVWFTVKPARNGPIVLATCGSSFDTLLAVYTGGSVGALTPVAAGDDSGACGSGSHASRVTFAGQAGVTYRVALDGKAGASGYYELRLTQRPGNDDFADAQPLQQRSGTWSGAIDLATVEPGEPGGAGASVWYAITPPKSGLLSVEVCDAGFDAGLAVYTGAQLSALAPAGSADGCDDGAGRRITLAATAGTTYRVAVTGASGAAGYFDLGYRLRPSNDDFADASVLDENGASGDTTGATREPGEPQHAGNAGAASVWYRYDAPRTATLRIQTCEEEDDGLDTLLAVYTGSGLDALTPVASSDDGCGTSSRVTLKVQAGGRYWIAVDGYGGAAGRFFLSVVSSPANDAIADATTLAAHPTTVYGSSAYATSEPGEPDHAGQPAAASVWSKFTPTAGGGISIDTCDYSYGFDTRLAVYTGTAGALTPVAADDDDPSCHDGTGSRVTFNAQAGVTYLIAVDGVGGDTGGYRLTFAFAPANDAFAAATDLGSSPYISSAYTNAASLEPGEPRHAGRTGGASIWYRFTPSVSRRVTIDTCGSGFDTLLAIYTGTSVDALTEVASDDDSPNCAGGHGSWLTLTLTAGTTYRIAIDGRDGATGYSLLDFVYNDAFADAQKLTPGLTAVTADPHAATLEPGEPDHAGATRSVWFDYTATRSATVSFDTCGTGADSVIGVYTGAAVDALTTIAASDDACGAGARVSIDAVNGTTYHVAVALKAGSNYINFLLTITTAPANDRFADAQALDPSQPYAQSPSLPGATHEPGEPAHAGVDGNGSVWYTLTLTRSTRVSLDTCSGYVLDTQLAVYTGTAVAALTPVASADDTPLCGASSTGARVAFDAQAGVTYRIAVDSKGSLSGYALLQLALGPVNDAFAAAATLTPGAGASAANTLASREPGEPAHAGDPGGGSLWYAFTAQASGRVVVDTCSQVSLDTVLAVYTGASVDKLTPVASNDNACAAGSRVEFTATQGTAYRIAVDGKGGATGTFRIRLSVPPADDDFAAASGVGFYTTGYSFSTRAATREAGEPAHAGNAGGGSIWYRFTPPRSVAVTIDTCGTSDFDSLLAVYTGTRVDALTPVGSSDDACGSGGRVTFDAAADTTYWIAIDGKGGATGDGFFQVVVPPGNDGFAGSSTLGTGQYYVDTRGATGEPGEPAHAGQPGGASVWYRYTPSVDGVVTVDTCTSFSSVDTLLAVYTGDALTALTPVAANDDAAGCGALSRPGSRVSFNARAGTTYRIALDGKNGQTGSIWLSLAQPPPNDALADAELLGGDHLTAYGSTRGATSEPGEPQHAGQAGGTSVWYRWTAAATGSVTLDTCGSSTYGDTLLAVYTGAGVGALTPVASNDDAPCAYASAASSVTFTAQAGTTYRIAVDARLGLVGTFTLALSLPPANDGFADARVLSGQAVQLTATNRRATAEAGEPSHGSRPGGASVWYRWTAPASGVATIETCGSDFDTLLAVYRGTALTALTPVTSDDDSCYPAGRVSFTATAGTEYRIAVDGYQGATGAIRLAIDAPANDLLSAAKGISGGTVNVSGTTAGAGLEPFESFHAGDRGGASVWFRWTAPATGPVDVDACGSAFDTLLDVSAGSSSTTGLGLEAANDDGASCGDGAKTSALRFQAAAGTTYSIALDGKGGASGAYALHLQLGIDVTPPETSIVSGPALLSNDATPTFAFAADEPADFECALDGDAPAPCATPATLGPLADGQHTLRVRAIDRAGNRDQTPATWTFTIDTVAPDTVLTAVPPDRGADARPQLRFSSPDGGTAYQCAVDAGAFAACVSPYTTPQLSDGRHTVQVRARDAAGNVDASPAQASFTVDTTPPVTSRLSGPAGQVGTSTVTFAWDAGEAGATYACSLDGAAFSSCTTPRTLSGLSDDDHSFRVRATDDVGNVETVPAEWQFSVEATPPETTLTSGPPALSGAVSVSFAFSSSEPGSTFECRLDAGPPTACASPLDVAVGEGDHVFHVTAIDRSQRRDPTPADYAFAIDRTAPDTTISSAPPALTNHAAAAFAFTSEAGAAFECALDGGAFAACASSYTTPQLADGPHELAVRAVDRAGNADATPATQRFTVDTVPPETTVTSAPAALIAVADATVGFSSDDAGATFRCTVDGSASGCATPLALHALADGAHSVQVAAIDAAGNADPTPARADFTVDTTPPQTSIDAAPPAIGNHPDVTLAFSGSEPGELRCALDGAPLAGCRSPQRYAGLADGVHDFRAVATDAAGNQDPTPATARFRIDTVAPDTEFTHTPPAPLHTGELGFSYRSTEPAPIGEPDGTVECAVDAGAFADCAGLHMTALDFDPGEHRFRVRAIDAAGNVDATPAEATFTIVDEKPLATLDVTPDGGPARLDVSASVAGSDADGDGLHYDLQWGDGSTASGVLPDPPATHRYADPGVYVVQLKVSDGRSSVTLSHTVTVTLPEPLEAHAGDDLTAVAGDPVTLDGADSRPLRGIDTYAWDFADGGSAQAATAQHTYAAPGEYDAELRVTGPGGASTDSVHVHVIARPPHGAEVTVRSGGAPLPGADVVWIAPDGARVQAVSGGDGVARLYGVADGRQTLYVGRVPGYLPARATIDIAGGEGTAAADLTRGDPVRAEIDSHPMTYDEIVAAGIDPHDPANQHMYQFEVHIDVDPVYGGGSGSFGGYVGSGGFVGGGGGGGGGGGCSLLVCVWQVGGATVYTSVKWVDGADGPMLTDLVIPFKATWLKEFYDVSLTVHNLASPGFTLDSGQATLALPAGLSLAPTARPQALTQAVGDIPGGGAATTTWILRGDDEGAYDLAATYAGSMQPFGRTVTVEGRTTKPIKVWGGSALRLTVDVDKQVQDGYPFLAQVKLKNVADVPVYNAAVELLKQGRHGYIEQPQQPRSYGTHEIAPGDTFTAGPYILVPDASGEVDLADSFIRKTAGDASPATTIVTHERSPSLDDTPKLRLHGRKDVVVLEWDPVPGATGYQVFGTPDRDIDFPREPIPVVRWLSLTKAIVAGDASQTLHYAVSSTIGGRPTLVHPLAHGGATFTEPYPSTEIQKTMACGARTAYLRMDFQDPDFQLAEWRWRQGAGDWETGGTLGGLRDSASRSFDLPGAGSVKLHFQGRNAEGTWGPEQEIQLGDCSYVALGDSFSSGEGVPPFEEGTDDRVRVADNRCHRSLDAYSRVLDTLREDVPLPTFVACSGALIGDFENDNHDPDNEHVGPQKDALGSVRAADLVTMTFGGNDVLFKTILEACVKDGAFHPFDDDDSTCKSAMAPKVDAAMKEALPKLPVLYRSVQALAAPGARVLVLAYPRIFPEHWDGGCEGIHAADVEWLYGLQEEFNAKLRDAALAAGVEFVSMGDLFNGHDVCTGGDGWFNKIRLPPNVEYSFHPNRLGQNAMAHAIDDYLGEPVPGDRIDVLPLQTVERSVAVAAGQDSFTASTSWPGSDVALSLVSPSGRVIDRTTHAADVQHFATGTEESYTIASPQPGDWKVRMYGADVAKDGEPVQLRTAQAAHRNTAPRALYTPSALKADVDQELRFDGTGSYDTDGSVASYRWDLGDGQAASGARVSHRFGAPGTYSVRLTVTDAQGATDSYDNVPIVIAAPVATTQPPQDAPPPSGGGGTSPGGGGSGGGRLTAPPALRPAFGGLTAPAGVTLKQLLKSGLKLTAMDVARGAKLELAARLADAKGRHPVGVGRLTVTARADGRVVLTLKIGKAAARTLKRAKAGSVLKVTVAGSGASSAPATRTLTVKLRR